MPFLKLISVEDATGIIKKIYSAATGRTGRVANIIQAMSLHGESCQASMELYMSLMKSENALDPAAREMLATVVSNANDCYYWTLSHARDFGQESGNQGLARQLVIDYRLSDLSASQKLLCDFAIQLTLAPSDSSADDIEALKDSGYQEPQIAVAIQVISYFNYINRIADGVGVEPESFMAKEMTKEIWMANKGRFK